MLLEGNLEFVMLVDVKNETELICSLKEKDITAFRHLYNAYAPTLFGTIQKMIGCPKAAEDVLQDVMLKIWSNSDKYDTSKGRLFTWMINIARNESMDYLRSKQYRNMAVTIRGIDVFLRERDDINKQMTRFDIRTLICQLLPKERAIMELILSGYTCKEVGQLFGMPEGTVKTKMRTSYRKLRLALQS